MDEQRAKDYIRGEMRSYLEQRGLPTGKNQFFSCLNPSHEDSSPSMMFYPDNNKVYCHGCHKSYDIFDLIGLEYNLNSFPEQFKKACELFHVDVDKDDRAPWYNQKTSATKSTQPVVKASPSVPVQDGMGGSSSAGDAGKKEYKDRTALIDHAAKNRQGAIDYLESRKIDGSLADTFDIGYLGYKDAVSGETWQAILIPSDKYSVVIRNTDPNAKSKNRYRKLGPAAVFGADYSMEKACTENRPLIVTEGELDCLSIISAGGLAVATGSTSNIDKFAELIKERIRDRKPVPDIILAMDNDETGRNAEAELKKMLAKVGCECSADIGLYWKQKDANDALRYDGYRFRQNILKLQGENGLNTFLAEKYLTASFIQDFTNGINESASTEPVRTGFDKLDTILDGGLYEGLYCLAAGSSIGKTAIVLQIADHIAASGHDVLYFSLEMSRFELMARSISRTSYVISRSYGDGYAKSARGILMGSRWKEYDDDVKIVLRKAVTQYANTTAKKLSILEGVMDMTVVYIRDTIKKYVAMTKKRPVVFLDYLQILSPTNERMTDKQKADQTITELKRLSREERIPIFVISSINRSGYNREVTFESLKESGGIEFSCDCVIGMHLKGIGSDNFEEKKARKQNPRDIELVILKQRNGSSGDKLWYNYWPVYNYFAEEG